MGEAPFFILLICKECLHLAFIGHLCYHVYNNRNEVNRGKRDRGTIC